MVKVKVLGSVFGGQSDVAKASAPPPPQNARDRGITQCIERQSRKWTKGLLFGPKFVLRLSFFPTGSNPRYEHYVH